MMKRYKKDSFIIIGIILFAVICYLVLQLFKTPGDFVVVMHQGVITEKYDLNIDTKVIISFEEDKYNILEIKNHRAYIIEATCPDKLCVKQHSISKTNETITCLPNQVVIKVISQNENIDIESGK